MCKRAVILAGGMGTRLKPYTLVLPKPLMPIGEYPILEIIIRQLSHYGFNHITIAVNKNAKLIMSFFEKGRKWNTNIDYSIENRPLGTMAPLKLIKNLPENFLVMNGDVLTNLNYGNFSRFHTDNKNIFTVSSCLKEIKNEYGVLSTNKGRLIDFKEKPTFSYEVSMGVYMLNKEVIKYIPENKAYGFDSLMLDLISSGNPACVLKFNGLWFDIGSPDDYISALNSFNKKTSIFLK